MAREFTEQQAIRNLQRYLRQLAFLDLSYPELPIDGIFEEETRNAVRIFQKKNGFAVTGEADRETWEAIYQAYLTSLLAYSKPVPVDIFHRGDSPTYMKYGDKGFHVSAVQYMLNEILIFYGDDPSLNADGTYGEKTSETVRLFQQIAALPQTGEVDLETWNRLTMLYNDLFLKNNQ